MSDQISSTQRLKFEMCLLFIHLSGFIQIRQISWAKNAFFGEEFNDSLFDFTLK